MFTKLRLWWALQKLRFRGALKPFQPEAAGLRAESKHKAEDQRILREWFEAAREIGLDLTPAAMAARYAVEFQPDSELHSDGFDREGGFGLHEDLHRRYF